MCSDFLPQTIDIGALKINLRLTKTLQAPVCFKQIGFEIRFGVITKINHV